MAYRIASREVQQDDKEIVEIYGLSTDNKPSGFASGSTFFAIDTSTIYMYEESSDTWYEIGGSSGGDS